MKAIEYYSVEAADVSPNCTKSQAKKIRNSVSPLMKPEKILQHVNCIGIKI